MTRAAALLLALLATLAAAPARAQDSTPAPRTGVVRPRAAEPRATAPVRPRATRRRPAARPATQASSPTRDSARAAVPTPPPGFSVQKRVEPDTVTVGDRFATGVAVTVPEGTRVALEIAKDSADRWRVLGAISATPRDSARSRWVLAANMVAWQPGLPDSLAATLRLTGPDRRVVALPVMLAFPTVRAVLPADSAQWRVRPPHDVWGSSVDPARMALLVALIVLALLLLALIAWWIVRAIRRRRARRDPATARERALALLERARTSGFIEAGSWKAYYSLIADALRGYIAVIEPALGEDLTTSEVIAGMRAAGRPEARVDGLEHLLRVSDLAKFARHGRAPDDARRDLDLAREWVEAYAAERDAAARPADAPMAAGVAP